MFFFGSSDKYLEEGIKSMTHASGKDKTTPSVGLDGTNRDSTGLLPSLAT